MIENRAVFLRRFQDAEFGQVRCIFLPKNYHQRHIFGQKGDVTAKSNVCGGV